MITIPFDLELAKKINNGERNGMIVTDGDNYRVEFVYHREESFPILGVIHTDHGIISDWFSNNGFGGKNYRLKLKVPEYTTFKDGDVLSNEQGDYLFILNTNGEYLTSFHASWKKGRGVVIPRKAHADCNNIEKYRLATEDERQKFIDAYEEPENPMEWLPCPRCGLRPLVWEFDNGRVTAWGCCLLSSGGQSRASNTVTSNSLHASFI